MRAYLMALEPGHHVIECLMDHDFYFGHRDMLNVPERNGIIL